MNSITQEYDKYETYINSIFGKSSKIYKLDKIPFLADVTTYNFNESTIYHCKHDCPLYIEYNDNINQYIIPIRNDILLNFVQIDNNAIKLPNICNIILTAHCEYLIVKGSINNLDKLKIDKSYINRIYESLDDYCSVLSLNKIENFEKIDSIFEYIKKNIDKVITIKEIAEEFDNSERNIQLLFSKILNLSPKKIYSAIRFNEARIALKKANKGDKIYDIVSPLQFWHMGQFAKDYSGYFGEMPAQTLLKDYTSYE